MTITLNQAALRTGAKDLLTPLSCVFLPGRVNAVLGPNGAGKTSLLSLVSGQRKPSGGEALLEGAPVASIAAPLLAKRRAVMSQESSVAFGFTVRDIVALGRYPHRLQPSRDEEGIIDAALAATDVSAFEGRIYNTLSGGEKARVQLARALAQIWDAPADGSSRWLLLDEPTAALDLAHQHQVMRQARAWAHGRNVGVIAVLHDLNLALRYADDVLVLADARLQGAGAVHEVLTPKLVERVWKVACHGSAAADGTPQYLFETGVQ